MKKIKENKIAMDKSQKVVFIIYFVLFIITSLLFLYPLFWTFCNSLKPWAEYTSNANGLPSSWNLGYYAEIFTSFKVSAGSTGRMAGFLEMTWNSIWQTCGGQFLNILASVFVAYPLARYKFPLHKFFFGIIIFRITIPVIGSGPVAYKFMRDIGMINNPPFFMLTYFTGFDLNALILYGYFKAIDRGYSEAANIDGASCFQVLFKIIIPQAMPAMFALYVRSVMGYWNVYSTAQISLSHYPNLALGIYNFEKIMPTDKDGLGAIKYFGAIIISSLVPIILFAFTQKTMLKNISVGGLKG